MYIEINETKYENIKRHITQSGNVAYIGTSLAGIGNISGIIGLYREDGFLMREDNTEDYLRTVIADGSITLSNLPEDYIPAPTIDQRVSDLENTMDTLLGVNE